jgi:hypothetical protein
MFAATHFTIFPHPMYMNLNCAAFLVVAYGCGTLFLTLKKELYFEDIW